MTHSDPARPAADIPPSFGSAKVRPATPDLAEFAPSVVADLWLAALDRRRVRS